MDGLYFTYLYSSTSPKVDLPLFFSNTLSNILISFIGTNSIFQINIFQCDDGWFKVEVLDRGLWGKYKTYICDQEFGVIDFLKSIKVIL